MLNTVDARKIPHNYRRIFDQVQVTRQPMIVIANNRPQVAIVSLETLATLVPTPSAHSAQMLCELLKGIHAGLKDVPLPADLSEHHNEYLWQECDAA
jgi:hypothetical protein